MPDSNEIDVFVSYAHTDRDRVRQIVEKLKAAGVSVWWDTEIEIGTKWRSVIYDRLVHAKSVCVVWSSNSTARDFVLDEAQYAAENGILIPILLDNARAPLGFGEFQFASLDDAETTDNVISRIVSRIRKLCQEGVRLKPSESISQAADWTRSGARQADRFLDDVRVRSDLLKRNPGSEQALRDALGGVRQTYEAVIGAIDELLAPLTSNGRLEIGWFKPIASGRMVEQIERQRGHCKRIVQIYIESGGLRESLPTTVSNEAKDALDHLMMNIGNADMDLFQQMTAIGSSLAKEGAVITNLILAEQTQSAEAHLRQSALTLIPLQQELAQGMARVDRLIADLGINLSVDSAVTG
jgi:hypothetical protein